MLFLSLTNVYAGGSGGSHKLSAISINGPYQHDEIVLAVATGSDPDNCTDQAVQSYMLLKSSPKYNQLYGLLLTAATKQMTVIFYMDGCFGGLPVIQNARLQVL